MWLIWCDIPVSHSWAKMSTGYTRISLSSRLSDTHTHTHTHSHTRTSDHINTYVTIPPREHKYGRHTCEHRCSIVSPQWLMTFCFVVGASAASQLQTEWWTKKNKKQPMCINPPSNWCKLLRTGNIWVCLPECLCVFNMLYITLYVSADSVISGVTVAVQSTQ